MGPATLLRDRHCQCHTGHHHRRPCCSDIAVFRPVLVLVEFRQDSRLLGLLPIMRSDRTICPEARVQSDRLRTSNRFVAWNVGTIVTVDPGDCENHFLVSARRCAGGFVIILNL